MALSGMNSHGTRERQPCPKGPFPCCECDAERRGGGPVLLLPAMWRGVKAFWLTSLRAGIGTPPPAKYERHEELH